jgi:DNA-binding CsgD family transcriptional regulator
MPVGIVEFTSEEPRLTGSLGADIAWRSTSRELGAALTGKPVDAIVFHVKLSDRNDLVETLRQVKELKPDVKMLLAASSKHVLVVSEITSIEMSRASRPRREVPLSAREMEVLEAIRSGRTNREIASLLGISLSTANKHVENILQKLSARNRAQAAAEPLGLDYQLQPRVRRPSVLFNENGVDSKRPAANSG